MSPDVVVVGAGIIGCSIAFELVKRGAQVTVIEAAEVGGGATQASAGVLAPYIEAPARGALLDLTTRSLSMYDEFIESLSADGQHVEYRRSGTLDIANDAAAAERLRHEQRQFPAELRWLGREETLECEPSVHESVEGALLAASHGYVHVPQLLAVLENTLHARGVEIRPGCRVTRVESRGGRFSLETDRGDRLSCGRLVVACGSWADQLSIDGGRSQGIKPIRGQLLKIRWIGPPISRVVWGPDCYVVPWQDGTLLVGATVEDVGFDQRTTLAGVRDLMDAVCALLPHAWRASLIEARAGLRPGSADGLPVVGPSQRVEGLTYAVGHYRNGILLAPLTAHVVADWVAAGLRDPVLAMMRPDRAKSGPDPEIGA